MSLSVKHTELLVLYLKTTVEALAQSCEQTAHSVSRHRGHVDLITHYYLDV